MITIKQFMELVNYRITEGNPFGWECYGPSAYCIDSWNGDLDGHSLSVIFDTKTQEVYEAQVHDYSRNRAYRLINPQFIEQHRNEAVHRGSSYNQAWDNVDYSELEVVEDFIEKATAIINNTNYDTRIQVPLTLDNDQLFELMKMAHEQDVTLNQLVEDILRKMISQINS